MKLCKHRAWVKNWLQSKDTPHAEITSPMLRLCQ